MGEKSDDFRDALTELVGTAYPQPAEHPSPELWLAYQRGELAAGDEARMQEHLVRCRDCFDLAAAAAAFAEPDGEPGARQEMETAALWRLLRPQLDPEADPLPQNVRNIRDVADGPRRPSRGFRLPTTLAATFFVALVGMTAWNFQIRAPRPNVPIFEVPADERGPAGQELTMTAGPQMLVLHPTDQLPVYRLAIRDAATGR